MIQKFKAKLEKGKLRIHQKDLFDMYLCSLPKDKELEVVVKVWRQNRSNNQNRYLFGVVYKIISEHLGYTDLELHEIFKAMFLSEEVEFQGETLTIVKSSTKLNTAEMEEFISRIRNWAAFEHKLTIPLPNEIEY